MLPARFEYHRPGSLEEALSLLGSLEDAKVLAGGQSLIPVMKLRFAAPAHLVDINGIPGLSGIREADGFLRIGALTRESELEESEVVRSRYPLLHDTSKVIADPLVRNLATVGGNLANASPAADLVPAADPPPAAVSITAGPPALPPGADLDGEVRRITLEQVELGRSSRPAGGGGDRLARGSLVATEHLGTPVHDQLRRVRSGEPEPADVRFLATAERGGGEPVLPAQRVPVVHVLAQRDHPHAPRRSGEQPRQRPVRRLGEKAFVAGRRHLRIG